MKVSRKLWLSLLAGVAGMTLANSQASAQQEQKPNILFIMGDDILHAAQNLSPRTDGR